MAKPLQVDEIWLERIAELLGGMEFGSLNIVVHEGQIVQMERTERRRYELNSGNASRATGASRHTAKPLRESRQR